MLHKVVTTIFNVEYRHQSKYKEQHSSKKESLMIEHFEARVRPA
jgi:hypothetical protein